MLLKTAALMLGFVAVASGCTSGCRFDPGALTLDSSQIKDYGNDVKANKAPIEAIVYGQLGPGDGDGGGGGSITLQFDMIQTDLNKIKDLPKNYTFSDAQKNDLANWAQALEDGIKGKLAPSLSAARKGANGAKDLATSTEPYVRTGGSLTATIADGESKVSDAAKERYKALAADVVKDFERLYQGSIVLAQGHMQHRGKLASAKAMQALERLKHDLQSATPVVPDANLAAAAVIDCTNAVQTLRDLLGRMTMNDKVARLLTAAKTRFDAAVLAVQNDYINVVNLPGHKPQSDALFADLDAARRDFDTIATDYPAIEALKSPVGGDAKLEALVLGAFRGDVMASLGLVGIDHETDINKLTSLLAKHDKVILASDNSSPLIIEGIASAVVFKMAPAFGLTGIANVVGPDHHMLNKARADLNMTEEQFHVFLTSRGKLIREHQNKDGYKNVFVVFADEFGGTDVNGMIEELMKDGGKVVVVTAKGAQYKDSKSFSHGFLDVSEGVVLSNAIIREMDDTINPFDLSETLVKLYAAFGDLTIGNLRPAVLDALSRVGDKRSTVDIERGVIAALAARGVPTQLVNPSGILKEPDVDTVQRNIRANKNFYVDAARYGDTEARRREHEESRRVADALAASVAAAKASDDVAAITRQANAEKMALSAAFKLVKEAARNKKEALDVAMQALDTALENRKNEIMLKINDMRSTADTCYVGQPNVIANIVLTFSDAARQALLNANFGGAVLGSNEDRAVKGNPNLAPGFNNSWASCLIFGSMSKNGVKETLGQLEAKVETLIDKLKSQAALCRTKEKFVGPTGMSACFKNAVKQFDDARKVMALAPGATKSFLQKITEAIGEIPEYNVGGVQNAWWMDSTAVASLPVANPPSFGGFIKNNFGSADLKNAYQTLNSHYYAKTILDISGTNEGSFKIRALPVKTITAINVLDTNVPANRSFTLLKPMLKDFDDNGALMVQTRREVDKQYDKVLAYYIANLISKQLVRELHENVLKPFWSLDPAELRLFEQGGPAGSSGAVRKQVWDEMKALVPLINKVAESLDRDFIQMSDGTNAAVAGTATLSAVGGSGIKDVVDAVDDLMKAIGGIYLKLVAGPNSALNDLTAALIAKVANQVRDPLRVLGAKTQGAGDIVANYLAALEQAYDLHDFNYFKMDNTPLSGGAPRNYPVGHSKAAGVAPTGTSIRHPLEP